MSLYFGGSDSGGRVWWRLQHKWGDLQNLKIKMYRTMILPVVVGIVVSRVARQWLDNGLAIPGFESLYESEIFYFKTLRQSLEFIQPPIQ